MGHVKFTSIDAFKSVWVTHTGHMNYPVVEYQKVVKIHGTNSAVRVEGGLVVGQKRSGDVEIGNDNAGFAAWLEPNKSIWLKASNKLQEIIPHKVVTFHGEWAGKGIQNKDAVTLISKKFFFIFAIEIDEKIYNTQEFMETWTPEHDDVMVLPVMETNIIDFANESEVRLFIELLNNEVENIGKLDPFIYDIFGIEGPGEGLVLSPKADGMDRNKWASFVFKAKCESHRVQKSSKAATIKVETPADVVDFVQTFVTSQRLEQGVTEIGGVDATKTRDFLNWMHADVRKESTLELEAMGKTYTDVAGHVAKKAAAWYVSKTREL